MYRMLLIFCVFNVFARSRAAEYELLPSDNNKLYDINELFSRSLRRFQSSVTLKNEHPDLLNNLQFKRFEKDFIFQPLEYLLQNSSKCLKDVLYTLESITDMWALSLFDSFGKPPESGILQGNFKWLGDYNECINVYAPPKSNSTAGNFHGKYCSLSLKMNLGNLTMPLPFSLGICVPDSCSLTELQGDTIQLLQIAGNYSAIDLESSLADQNVTLTCYPTERHLNAPAKAVIALLSIFCALTLLGSSVTVVKYLKKILKEPRDSSLSINISDKEHIIGDQNEMPKQNSEADDQSLLENNASKSEITGNCEKFLLCFCMFTNGAKLLNTDSSEGQLLCIHGIRFLSMSWVILGHTYMFGFQTTRNVIEATRTIDDFPFQAILQGFYSVDSFFVLSGFLLSYLFMKEFSKKKGSISWPYFYLHRYLRLTPIYMLVLAFSATVFYYLGSGPSWVQGDFDPICRDNWWWNLLYINNFNDEQCMGWSWYLANDMQFFVISPIFLITLWRWPKIGYSLIGMFLCACWLSNFFITYHFDLMTGLTGFLNNGGGAMDMGQAIVKFADFFQKLYVKPYTRIGPYLIGILVGYLLYKRKATNRPKHNLVILCIGWIVASTVTLTCVYGLYHKHPGVVASSIYNAFNRTLFGMGLSWVIYVCLINQGGFINSILSYKLFIPLSRLTYSAYLIHPLILTGYYSSLKTTFEFSHPTVVILFLGFMVVTYGLSFPVSLVLESPIVALEKWIRSSFNKQKTETT